MIQDLSTSKESDSQQDSSQTYSLHVRLGQAEFNGEGPRQQVRDDYQSFLEVLHLIGTSLNEKVVGQEPRKPAIEEQDTGSVIDAVWDRLYKRDKDQLSLLVLPETKSKSADSVLLIIYGYQKLFEQEAVNSTTIMLSAKQSGLSLERLDRIMTFHKDLIIRGGKAKGARYSLNNRGLKYAEELLGSMFD